MKKILCYVLLFILLISNVSGFALILPDEKVQADIFDNSEIEESQTQINESAKFQEYLEYQKGKEVMSDNINIMWLHIISLFQLLYELLILALSVFSIWLMIYVFIELLPNSLMYIRDIILGLFINDRRPKRRKKRIPKKTIKTKKTKKKRSRR